MPADPAQLRRYLQAFDFPRLLVEELGWNHYPARPMTIEMSGATYTLEPLAEKAGFVVYLCDPGPAAEIPPYPISKEDRAASGQSGL